MISSLVKKKFRVKNKLKSCQRDETLV